MKATIQLKTPEPQLVSSPKEEDICRKFLQLRSSAERRNKEFDLSIVDVKRLLTLKRCQYTGVLMYIQPHDETNKLPHGRSIDRLDPNKGYVKGNVFAVTHVVNQIKNVLFEDKESIVSVPFGDVITMMSKLSKLGFKGNV